MEEIKNASQSFDIYKFFNMKEKKIQCINYEILYGGEKRIIY